MQFPLRSSFLPSGRLAKTVTAVLVAGSVVATGSLMIANAATAATPIGPCGGTAVRDYPISLGSIAVGTLKVNSVTSNGKQAYCVELLRKDSRVIEASVSITAHGTTTTQSSTTVREISGVWWVGTATVESLTGAVPKASFKWRPNGKVYPVFGTAKELALVAAKPAPKPAAASSRSGSTSNSSGSAGNSGSKSNSSGNSGNKIKQIEQIESSEKPASSSSSTNTRASKVATNPAACPSGYRIAKDEGSSYCEKVAVEPTGSFIAYGRVTLYKNGELHASSLAAGKGTTASTAVQACTRDLQQKRAKLEATQKSIASAGNRTSLSVNLYCTAKKQ